MPLINLYSTNHPPPRTLPSTQTEEILKTQKRLDMPGKRSFQFQFPSHLMKPNTNKQHKPQDPKKTNKGRKSIRNAMQQRRKPNLMNTLTQEPSTPLPFTFYVHSLPSLNSIYTPIASPRFNQTNPSKTTSPPSSYHNNSATLAHHSHWPSS